MDKFTFSIVLTVEDTDKDKAKDMLLRKLDCSGIEFVEFESIER
jgi:hypothetical protein